MFKAEEAPALEDFDELRMLQDTPKRKQKRKLTQKQAALPEGVAAAEEREAGQRQWHEKTYKWGSWQDELQSAGHVASDLWKMQRVAPEFGPR